ncbi:MAG: nicotinamide mononucleotide transporter [Cyclobacteriaceae bacterium]|nr:nicotinamide mononucleotide transporter [Cyclobacteriaceae bacterium]
MSAIEIGAVIFSLLSVGFAIRRSVWNWPLGIIGVALYLVLFYEVKLFADMILQAVFVVQGIYGWYLWTKNRNIDHIVNVAVLNLKQRLLITVAIVMFSILWAEALIRYTEASMPYVDALASTLSFAATWTMARRKIECWILWITADIIYIGLFWYKELFLSSGIYTLFLVLAVIGFIRWNKNLINTASH